jgi:hypothetical protein
MLLLALVWMTNRHNRARHLSRSHKDIGALASHTRKAGTLSGDVKSAAALVAMERHSNVAGKCTRETHSARPPRPLYPSPPRNCATSAVPVTLKCTKTSSSDRARSDTLLQVTAPSATCLMHKIRRSTARVVNPSAHTVYLHPRSRTSSALKRRAL